MVSRLTACFENMGCWLSAENGQLDTRSMGVSDIWMPSIEPAVTCNNAVPRFHEKFALVTAQIGPARLVTAVIGQNTPGCGGIQRACQ